MPDRGLVNASGNWIDALSLLVNASDSFPAIQSLIAVVSTMIGVILVGVSLLDMYHMAANNGANWGGRQAPTPLGVVTKFFVGGILVSSAYFLYVSGNTFVGQNVATDAMLYGGGQSTNCEKAKYAVFFFIALVGQLAFIRGWILLNRYANRSQPEGLGMGLTFIVGGTLCYFLSDIGEIMAEWFGVSMQLKIFCPV